MEEILPVQYPQFHKKYGDPKIYLWTKILEMTNMGNKKIIRKYLSEYPEWSSVLNIHFLMSWVNSQLSTNFQLSLILLQLIENLVCSLWSDGNAWKKSIRSFTKKDVYKYTSVSNVKIVQICFLVTSDHFTRHSFQTYQGWYKPSPSLQLQKEWSSEFFDTMCQEGYLSFISLANGRIWSNSTSQSSSRKPDRYAFCMSNKPVWRYGANKASNKIHLARETSVARRWSSKRCDQWAGDPDFIGLAEENTSLKTLEKQTLLLMEEFFAPPGMQKNCK